MKSIRRYRVSVWTSKMYSIKWQCKHPHIRTYTHHSSYISMDLISFGMSYKIISISSNNDNWGIPRWHYVILIEWFMLSWIAIRTYILCTIPVHLRSQFLWSIFHILRSYSLLVRLNFNRDEMWKIQMKPIHKLTRFNNMRMNVYFAWL